MNETCLLYSTRVYAKKNFNSGFVIGHMRSTTKLVFVASCYTCIGVAFLLFLLSKYYFLFLCLLVKPFKNECIGLCWSRPILRDLFAQARVGIYSTHGAGLFILEN